MTPLPESAEDFPASSELMLLPDGRILAHHLTPELAQVLRQLSDVVESTSSSQKSPPVPVS